MWKVIAAVIGYAFSKFVVKLMAALGLAFITYKGLEALVEKLIDGIVPSLSGLPVTILNLMALSGVPEGLTIVCSAFMTSAAIGAAKVLIGVSK